MTPHPAPPPARLKPSFVIALALHALITALFTVSHASTPATKQGGTTGYLVFITALLAGLSLLSPVSAWARGFVFTDGAWPAGHRRIRWAITLWAMAVLAGHFLGRGT